MLPYDLLAWLQGLFEVPSGPAFAGVDFFSPPYLANTWANAFLRDG